MREGPGKWGKDIRDIKHKELQPKKSSLFFTRYP